MAWIGFDHGDGDVFGDLRVGNAYVFDDEVSTAVAGFPLGYANHTLCIDLHFVVHVVVVAVDGNCLCTDRHGFNTGGLTSNGEILRIADISVQTVGACAAADQVARLERVGVVEDARFKHVVTGAAGQGILVCGQTEARRDGISAINCLFDRGDN